MVQPPEASIRASQELTLCIDFHKVWSPTDMIHSSQGTQTARLLRQRLCTLFLRAAVGGYTGACASKATADLGRSSSISKKGTTTNKQCFARLQFRLLCEKSVRSLACW